MKLAINLCVFVAVANTFAFSAEPMIDEAQCEHLQAEIQLLGDFHMPGDDVYVRFLLHNTGTTPIEIPLRWETSQVEGSGLPLELVGYLNPNMVSLTRDGRPIKPAARADVRDTPGNFKIAPKATVGKTVNLATLFNKPTYPGDYKLSWKPLDGQLKAATLTFAIEQQYQAVFATDYGIIVFELFYDKAPKNVANFVELVKSGFYDGTEFHAIAPGIAMEGGRPKNGNRDSIRPDGKTVQAEINRTPFDLGTLAMSLKKGDPNSGSCQFFISLGKIPAFNGKYTAFGQATNATSLSTLRRICAVETNKDRQPMMPVVIRSITLEPAKKDKQK